MASGDDLLFAYGTGSEQLLKLSGPTVVQVGAPLALRVTDLASGAPVTGATVDGHASGADGNVIVGPYGARGEQDLKATKPGAIRSNRLAVCVSGAANVCGDAVSAPSGCATTGDDGLCGTKDRRAPRGRILSIRNGQRFAKGKGPRLLAGTVSADPSGIADARLRLTRNDHGRCATYDARSERLVALRRCGAVRGRWFSAGNGEQWSYLLPARLGRGRYVFDVRARDRAGNVDALLQRTRTRVVFFVS